MCCFHAQVFACPTTILFCCPIDKPGACCCYAVRNLLQCLNKRIFMPPMHQAITNFKLSDYDDVLADPDGYDIVLPTPPSQSNSQDPESAGQPVVGGHSSTGPRELGGMQTRSAGRGRRETTASSLSGGVGLAEEASTGPLIPLGLDPRVAASLASFARCDAAGNLVLPSPGPSALWAPHQAEFAHIWQQHHNEPPQQGWEAPHFAFDQHQEHVQVGPVALHHHLSTSTAEHPQLQSITPVGSGPTAMHQEQHASMHDDQRRLPIANLSPIKVRQEQAPSTAVVRQASGVSPMTATLLSPLGLRDRKLSSLQQAGTATTGDAEFWAAVQASFLYSIWC